MTKNSREDLVILICLLLTLLAVVLNRDSGESHNLSGGYVDQCDSLPGLIGDDC